MKTELYIISIAFQLSGALLLMIFSLSTKRERVVKKFINKNIIIQNYDETLHYDKSELKETFKIAYLNKCSFLFIALGYLIGVMGEMDNCNILDVMIKIVILTGVLMIFAYFIVYQIIKHAKKVNTILTKEEMTKYSIVPNIEMATEKDIDDLLNNIFRT